MMMKQTHHEHSLNLYFHKLKLIILSFKRLGKMGQTRMVKDEEISLPRLLLVTYRSSKGSAYEKRIQVAVFNIRDEGNTN